MLKFKFGCYRSPMRVYSPGYPCREPGGQRMPTTVADGVASHATEGDRGSTAPARAGVCEAGSRGRAPCPRRGRSRQHHWCQLDDCQRCGNPVVLRLSELECSGGSRTTRRPPCARDTGGETSPRANAESASTSPWSIPGYHNIPQGSTIVNNIMNWMTTVLV